MTSQASPALAEELGRLTGRLHPRVAAVRVRVDDDAAEVALLGGLTAGSDLEIGSVSKGVTGLLYADACGRGEVTPSTRLDSCLALAGTPAGAVTLGALATHTGGLPRLPAARHPVRRTVALLRHGTNPYGDTLAELLAQTRSTRVGRARPAYSNLGFELLGHALAAAAGTSYAELVRLRLAEPLGLTGTWVPSTGDDVGPEAVQGRSRRERRTEPWTGEALGPAGGVRSTPADLGRLLRALLAGTAPGTAALDPVADLGRGIRIGAAWVTLHDQGRPVTWHNGRTGGFASWVGLDREAGVGVAVLSATSASVDRAGFALLRSAVQR